MDRLELMVWKSCHRYAPMAPRKVRLVADLIRGCYAQEALDILQFTNKRAAGMVRKVLQCAIANADEQEADIGRLYVSDARVDEGGIMHSALPAGSRQPGNPQLSKVPFSGAAVAVGVCAGTDDGFFDGPQQFAASTNISPCLFEQPRLLPAAGGSDTNSHGVLWFFGF